MDTDVEDIEVKTMGQKVLEKDFFSKIIDESIKKGYEDLTAFLLDKCQGKPFQGNYRHSLSE